MKHQHLELSLLFLFAVVSSGVRAQNMHVWTNSQGISPYPIETISKLTFPDGNLLVSNPLIPNATFGLSEVRKITFNAALGTAQQQQQQQQQVSLARAFYVYPNPVRDLLHIGSNNNALLASQIAIISLEGRLLLQQNQRSAAHKTINVSALPSGLYL